MDPLRFIRTSLIGCSVLVSPLYAEDSYVDPNLVTALQQAVKETPSFSTQLDALFWLADMSDRLKVRIPDTFYRVGLLKAIHTEASRANLEPELVLAVIEVESSFDRLAVSSSGARGLMQVMPFWKKEIGHPRDDLFFPRTNLRYGCTILSYYLKSAGGDLEVALYRYNGAGDKAYPHKVLLAFNETWRTSAP